MEAALLLAGMVGLLIAGFGAVVAFVLYILMFFFD